MSSPSDDDSEAKFDIHPCELPAYIFPNSQKWWTALRSTAMEVAQAPFNDLTTFQANCLMFATIQTDKPAKQWTWQQRTQLFSCQNSLSRNKHYLTGNDDWDSPTNTPWDPTSQTIGIVYLCPPLSEQIIPGVVNIGLALDVEEQQKGTGALAVTQVLNWGFDDLRLHRIQANILDNPRKDDVLKLLTNIGFVFEGIRRSAVIDPIDGCWKDVLCLTILDTDWAFRSLRKCRPMTAWDEMFARHAKEREMLLGWQREKRARRNSLQTLRPAQNSMKGKERSFGHASDDDTLLSSESGSSFAPSESGVDSDNWSFCCPSTPPISDFDDSDLGQGAFSDAETEASWHSSDSVLSQTSGRHSTPYESPSVASLGHMSSTSLNFHESVDGNSDEEQTVVDRNIDI